MKLFKPYMSKFAIKNVMKVLKSSQLAEGPEVKKFERKFAVRFSKNYVCALNSGSSALELAYELAGIGEGDEVITPVLTCTATNLPLIRRKAKIVFADIGRDLNVSVEDVISKVTAKTKAIVFVHFGGNNRGLKEIIEFAKKHNIIVIEDAAQAVGSEYWGHADFTIVSLQAIKILTAGDGGFLICKKREHHELAKKLRWFGYDRDEKQLKGDTDLTIAGYKYHMNDITAAIGLGNLREIDEILAHRKKLAYIYSKYGLFAHTWLAGGFTENYGEMKKAFDMAGIEIGQHHYRNDKYTIFGGRQKLPMMDELENKYFFVPFHRGMSGITANKIGKLWRSLNKLKN